MTHRALLFQKHHGTMPKRRTVQTRIKPEWLTYEDAQRLTSLGRTTLWRIVKSGEVKSAYIGRAVRISRKSLEEHMERAAEGTLD
jgi:excisionase family DNA binding protein